MQSSMGIGLQRQGKWLWISYGFCQSIHISLMTIASILFFFLAEGGGGVVCLCSFLVDQYTQDLSGVTARNLGSGYVQY